MNPHFLFNSLNSIQALIEENAASARQAVGQLAGVLRFSLRQRSAKAVPLREELEMIAKYLAIEGLRFEEKLVVHTDISPEVEDLCAPGFLLHPLVENAVKYGMQTSAMPLQIRICAVISDGRLRLEVANTGRWLEGHENKPEIDGSGLGLQIVREQLELNYRGKYDWKRTNMNGWVRQQIEIAGLMAEKDHALSRVAVG